MEFLRQMEAFIGDAHAGGMRVGFAATSTLRAASATFIRRSAIRARRAAAGRKRTFDRILGRGLVDVGRALDPDNDNLFTWWAPWRKLRERNIGWRIDYILASEALAAKAVQCAAYREIGTSDHAPVIALFDLGAEAIT